MYSHAILPVVTVHDFLLSKIFLGRETQFHHFCAAN